MDNNKNIRMRFDSIKMLSYNMDADEYLPKTRVNSKINHSLNYQKGSDIIAVQMTVSYRNESNENPFLSLDVIFNIQVQKEDLDLIILNEDSEIELPKYFVRNIVQLSYDSLRGIIFAKTEGTSFDRFILPLHFFNID